MNSIIKKDDIVIAILTKRSSLEFMKEYKVIWSDLDSKENNFIKNGKAIYDYLIEIEEIDKKENWDIEGVEYYNYRFILKSELRSDLIDNFLNINI